MTYRSCPPLLEISHLTLGFGNAKHVVEDVSLNVNAGELVALVGESGSGKSLTALSVLGLTPTEAKRHSGVIRFNGHDVTSTHAVTPLRGNRIAMVFQEPMTALNPLHTIGRQIIESFRLHTRADRATCQAHLLELLDMVGLNELQGRLDAYPHHLSGGQRQRVMIAMAMANRPDLLICDEPTTALDVTLQQQILALLTSLQAKHHMGILLITHDLSVVRKIADRVAVMQQGRIIESGKTNDVFTNPQHPYTRHLIHALPDHLATHVAADAPTILSAESLSVRFPIKSSFLRRITGYVNALSSVNLSLKRGETLGIVGESGSGKSTLALALLRLTASEGRVVFMGSPIDSLSQKALRPLRRQMQLVFQDPFSSLNPRMTIGEIIAEGLRVHESLTQQERDLRVKAMLRDVGLEPEMASRYPHSFSGGQRQRIAIARAMILNPALVILDEPTSALDMSLQQQILALLAEFQRTRNVSYILISHDLRVIRALSHRVMVMRHGEVIESADVETLYTDPQHDYTRSLLDAVYR
jgi:microcin C transport system ATP-binding protein